MNKIRIKNKKYLEQKLIDFNENGNLRSESQLEKDYLERKNTKEDYLEKEMNEKLRFNLKVRIISKII